MRIKTITSLLCLVSPLTIANNLIVNSTISGTQDWYMKRGEIYFSTISRSDDSSGSFYLERTTTQGVHDWVVTKTFPINSTERYYVELFAKANADPSV